MILRFSEFHVSIPYLTGYGDSVPSYGGTKAELLALIVTTGMMDRRLGLANNKLLCPESITVRWSVYGGLTCFSNQRMY